MKWNERIYFLVFLIVCGCSSKITERNNEIDAETKKEVRFLVNQIIEGFTKNEPEKILDIATDAFKSVAEENLTENIFGPDYPIIANKYLIIDEYCQKSLRKGVQSTILSERSDNHDYILSVIPAANEIYVSIGYFDVPNIQCGFCFVFVKQNEKWLLNYLNAGILQIARKDVIDWFEEAQKDYKEGDLCNVALKLGIIKQILDKNQLPFKYVNERELRKKGQVMFENIREKIIFPMKIDKIETKPCVIGIVPRIESDTLFPIIKYVTKLDARDTVLLEQECDNLHENIGQLFPKIKHNTTRIYYQVFTDDSENKKEVITPVFSRTFKM